MREATFSDNIVRQPVRYHIVRRGRFPSVVSSAQRPFKNDNALRKRTHYARTITCVHFIQHLQRETLKIRKENLRSVLIFLIYNYRKLLIYIFFFRCNVFIYSIRYNEV